MDGDNRLGNKEEIMKHLTGYFTSLYAEERWDRPSLDNMGFGVIWEEARWLERKFEEDEICDAIFALAGIGPRGRMVSQWLSSNDFGQCERRMS